MRSKWFDKHNIAVNLRRKGLSIRAVEKKLGIPRSTLSGWFKNVKLSNNLKKKLLQNQRDSLRAAGKKAAARHRIEKEKRISEALNKAKEVVEKIKLSESEIQELALAMLYLGEGTKSSSNIRMANSNPDILKTFIKLISSAYGISKKDIKCGLNLRYDQDVNKMKIFWSRELGIPVRNITYVFVDRRAASSKTYPDYKGVCLIRCGDVSTKRRIEAIGNQFCVRVIQSSLQ